MTRHRGDDPKKGVSPRCSFCGGNWSPSHLENCPAARRTWAHWYVVAGCSLLVWSVIVIAIILTR